MAGLPIIKYLSERLNSELSGKKVRSATLTKINCVHVRGEGFQQMLREEELDSVFYKGNFIHIKMKKSTLIINLLESGRLQCYTGPKLAAKPQVFSINFDNGAVLNFADKAQSARVFLVSNESLSDSPDFAIEGVDIFSDDFSLKYFTGRIDESESSVRAFLTDSSVISSIGSVYADEILFKARIHPKTLCEDINSERRVALYRSIIAVMKGAYHEIEEAMLPIDSNHRGHMNVRNRHGEPCPVCGTSIEKDGIFGYDIFFCPNCQQDGSAVVR